MGLDRNSPFQGSATSALACCQISASMTPKPGRSLILFLTTLSVLCSSIAGEVVVSTCSELKKGAKGDHILVLGADIKLTAECNSIPIKGSLTIVGGPGRFSIDGLGLYGGVFVVKGSLTVARITFKNIVGTALLSKNGGNISAIQCTFNSVEHAIRSPPAGDIAGTVVVMNTSFEGNGRCISALRVTVTGSLFVSNTLVGIKSMADDDEPTLLLTPSINVSATTFTENLFPYAIIGPNVAVSNCTFDRNVGGAIATGDSSSTSATMWVSECIFISNGSPMRTCGGAILVSNSDARVDIMDSHFQENVSGGSGGAITFQSGTSAVGKRSVTRTVFLHNSAQNGGAIASSEGLTVENSTFLANNATDSGGAIFIDPDNKAAISLEIKGSGFAANEANDKGGAIVVQSGGAVNIFLMLTAFARNNARTGGALSLTSDVVDVLSCQCVYVGSFDGTTTKTQVFLKGAGKAAFFPPLDAGSYVAQGGVSCLAASADTCDVS